MLIKRNESNQQNLKTNPGYNENKRMEVVTREGGKNIFGMKLQKFCTFIMYLNY